MYGLVMAKNNAKIPEPDTAKSKKTINLLQITQQATKPANRTQNNAYLLVIHNTDSATHS
jgi:hypothetical protein